VILAPQVAMMLLFGAQTAPGLPSQLPSPKPDSLDVVSVDAAKRSLVVKAAEGNKTVDLSPLGEDAVSMLAPGQAVRLVSGDGGSLVGIVISKAANAPQGDDTQSLAQVLPETTAEARVVVVDIPGRRLCVREGGKERILALEGLAARTVSMAEPGQEVLLYLKDPARASGFVITGWPSP